MSALTINPNIVVIKNKKIQNGVYILSHKPSECIDVGHRFVVNGLPNTFVYLAPTAPNHLTRINHHTRKVLVVDDEVKFIEDLNNALVEKGIIDVIAQIKDGELVFDEKLEECGEFSSIGDMIDSVTQRFNLRPSDITMSDFGNKYPQIFLCLSIMTEKDKKDTIDNETINEILKSTPLYKIGAGTTRKTVYVSPTIDDYTLTLFKMMSYRIRVTLRVNRKSPDIYKRYALNALRDVVVKTIRKS